MEWFQFDNLKVIIDKDGSQEFSKVSFPIRYGRFSEIQTPDYIYQVNLNGEIKYIQGRARNWPHSDEWLKRTVTNDWLYYSAGSYNGIRGIIGEYYFPCLPYPSNSIFNSYAIDTATIKRAVQAWGNLQSKIKARGPAGRSNVLEEFLTLIAKNDTRTLQIRSNQYPKLIGGRITVLPPDTRHVDYETIPVIIIDGCLYRCGFCRINSGKSLNPRSRMNIIRQIKRLKKFYHRDIRNYNSVFLGQHDALFAQTQLIEFASSKVYELFEFEKSYLKNPRLFLFGSVDSMLRSAESHFEMLNRLPFTTYINLGLESVDRETLAVLKKPITVEAVKDAFNRMMDINQRYQNIEVSVNFVLGHKLPPGHIPSLIGLLRNSVDRNYSKGSVYLSPLIGGGANREMLKQFFTVKKMSRLPVYIYLIQRL